MVEAVIATYRKLTIHVLLSLALLVEVFTRIRNLLLHISTHTLTNFEAIQKMKTIERDRAKVANDKLLTKIIESTLISLTNMYQNLWRSFNQLLLSNRHKLLKVKRVKCSMPKTPYSLKITSKKKPNHSTVPTKTLLSWRKHLPALNSASSLRCVQRIN